MAAYASILLDRDGPVARLTFNRPDRRNALTHAMMLELEDAFAELRADGACRVLVLRGAGGHFCAGGDLDAMADMPPRPANGGKDPLVPAYRKFGDALLALNTLPQATVELAALGAAGLGEDEAALVEVSPQPPAGIGAEISGHYFFEELHGGDDGLFAALRLMAWLDQPFATPPQPQDNPQANLAFT